MSTGAVVADLAELAAVDMSSVTEAAFLKVLDQGGADYIYDPAYAGAANSPFTILATTGGGGWYATGTIYGAAAPTGAAQYPVSFGLTVTTSTGTSVDQVYWNPGGDSLIWKSEILS